MTASVSTSASIIYEPPQGVRWCVIQNRSTDTDIYLDITGATAATVFGGLRLEPSEILSLEGTNATASVSAITESGIATVVIQYG
ncbi:MAG: hypothetical protein LBR07_05245 [Puniceicoccales bacterium]|jgi:hypothetical protein|nr:hypothetical protein [Puniceicoccales bacterium]